MVEFQFPTLISGMSDNINKERNIGIKLLNQMALVDFYI